MKTALYERDRPPIWVKGRMLLLDDTCHQMMAFVAQGAGMALEDGVVLDQLLADITQPDRIETALRRSKALGVERTQPVQIGLRSNNWLRSGANVDWVYGYDAWSVRPFQF